MGPTKRNFLVGPGVSRNPARQVEQSQATSKIPSIARSKANQAGCNRRVIKRIRIGVLVGRPRSYHRGSRIITEL